MEWTSSGGGQLPAPRWPSVWDVLVWNPTRDRAGWEGFRGLFLAREAKTLWQIHSTLLPENPPQVELSSVTQANEENTKKSGSHHWEFYHIVGKTSWTQMTFIQQVKVPTSKVPRRWKKGGQLRGGDEAGLEEWAEGDLQFKRARSGRQTRHVLARRMQVWIVEVGTSCEMPWMPEGNLNWTVNSGGGRDWFLNRKIND